MWPIQYKKLGSISKEDLFLFFSKNIRYFFTLGISSSSDGHVAVVHIRVLKDSAYK